MASDPRDGERVTAVAGVELQDASGSALGVGRGFATASFPDQQLLDKSISEAVERAVWAYLHDRGELVGHSTVGSAVHPDHSAAETAAHNEIVEKSIASTRFRSNDLGEPVDYRGSDGAIPDRDTRFWLDRTNRVVIAGAFSSSLYPRLAAASASFSTLSELALAQSHALAEITQVLPWARRLGAPASGDESLDPAANRIRWWSDVSPATATRVWSALTSGRSTAVDVDLRSRSHILTHRATIQIGRRVLYFRRVEIDGWQEPEGGYGGAPDPFF